MRSVTVRRREWLTWLYCLDWLDRLNWLKLRKWIANKLLINSVSCVNAAAQFAGIAALDGSDDSINEISINEICGDFWIYLSSF